MAKCTCLYQLLFMQPPRGDGVWHESILRHYYLASVRTYMERYNRNLLSHRANRQIKELTCAAIRVFNDSETELKYRQSGWVGIPEIRGYKHICEDTGPIMRALWCTFTDDLKLSLGPLEAPPVLDFSQDTVPSDAILNDEGKRLYNKDSSLIIAVKSLLTTPFHLPQANIIIEFISLLKSTFTKIRCVCLLLIDDKLSEDDVTNIVRPQLKRGMVVSAIDGLHLVPVLVKEVRWYLIIVDEKKGMMTIYDHSFKGVTVTHRQICGLIDAHLKRLTGRETVYAVKCGEFERPRIDNYDSGIWIMAVSDATVRDHEIRFTQEHMLSLRTQIFVCVCSGNAHCLELKILTNDSFVNERKALFRRHLARPISPRTIDFFNKDTVADSELPSDIKLSVRSRIQLRSGAQKSDSNETCSSVETASFASNLTGNAHSVSGSETIFDNGNQSSTTGPSVTRSSSPGRNPRGPRSPGMSKSAVSADLSSVEPLPSSPPPPSLSHRQSNPGEGVDSLTSACRVTRSQSQRQAGSGEREINPPILYGEAGPSGTQSSTVTSQGNEVVAVNSRPIAHTSRHSGAVKPTIHTYPAETPGVRYLVDPADFKKIESTRGLSKFGLYKKKPDDRELGKYYPGVVLGSTRMRRILNHNQRNNVAFLVEFEGEWDGAPIIRWIHYEHFLILEPQAVFTDYVRSLFIFQKIRFTMLQKAIKDKYARDLENLIPDDLRVVVEQETSRKLKGQKLQSFHKHKDRWKRKRK